MGGDNLKSHKGGAVGLYRKALLAFIGLALLVISAYLYGPKLVASSPVLNGNDSELTLNLTLSENGALYSEKAKLAPEIFTQPTTYRYRLQVLRNPKEPLDQLVVYLTLPQAGDETNIGHRFINNGGALLATSQLTEPQQLEFVAENISTQSQLSIEFEIPKKFIKQSVLLKIRESASDINPAYWVLLSIGLPLLALAVMGIVTLGRNRKVSAVSAEITAPPTKLAPAMLGMLLRGRISNRELAATLVDLARRGHLVIREVSATDFRFRRQVCSAPLLPFEQLLLDQLFGRESNRVTTDEISFFMAQELFSKRISEAFILAYQELGDYGYYATNPLALHRRYQITGVLLLIVSLVGFMANIFIFQSYAYLLFFWAGMVVVSVLVMANSKSMPARTRLGDRELANWLAFRHYLSDPKPIHFSAISQDAYTTYLPYAIIMEAEVEWSQRFIDIPFSLPNWFVSANIATIEDFSRELFPMLGYISHVLTLSVEPTSR